MSHLATVKTQFKDVEALGRAADVLGLSLSERGDVRIYGGVQSADFVLRLEGPYDVGFRRSADETLTIVTDNEVLSNYDNGRNNIARALLGDQLSRLKQEYAYACASIMAERQNYGITRENRVDGSVRVVLQRR